LRDALGITDFFVAGLGFDIAGAVLLARGVIGKPVDASSDVLL